MTTVRQKEDLLAWANSHRQLDTVTKFVLYRMAMIAEADHRAWMAVATLADAVNKSERTIRYHLRDLENAGLIEKTGEVHRLHNSTRSVPYYQLAPGVEGFDLRAGMPAKIAGIEAAHPCNEVAGMEASGEAHPCNLEGGMPAIGLQAHKELKGTEEEANASSSARERACALMVSIRAAYPRRALGWSDPEASLAALIGLIEAGVEVDELPGCAARMAEDPAIKRRDFGPPRMEAWLAKRQFEGWWPEAAAEPQASAEGEPSAIPADVVEALGADFLRSWAAGAAWREADRTLVVRLKFQADRFRSDKAAALAGVGVRVISRAEAAQAEGAV